MRDYIVNICRFNNCVLLDLEPGLLNSDQNKHFRIMFTEF